MACIFFLLCGFGVMDERFWSSKVTVSRPNISSPPLSGELGTSSSSSSPPPSVGEDSRMRENLRLFLLFDSRVSRVKWPGVSATGWQFWIWFEKSLASSTVAASIDRSRLMPVVIVDPSASAPFGSTSIEFATDDLTELPAAGLRLFGDDDSTGALGLFCLRFNCVESVGFTLHLDVTSFDKELCVCAVYCGPQWCGSSAQINLQVTQRFPASSCGLSVVGTGFVM